MADDSAPAAEESQDRLIDWTGERCVPWAPDVQVVYEHYHRYCLADRFVTGKRVLDLASGEGYGAALLAERAASVVGVDIDELTIDHARRNYPLDNLTFQVGSITDPGLFKPDAFDVITCFEAIEHVTEQDSLLDLVERTLTAGGLFFSSTPDRTVYTDELHQDNPYHVRELDEAEYRSLLESRFKHVAIWGQAVAVGSLLTAHGGIKGAPEAITLQARDERSEWALRRDTRYTYLVAVASNSPLPPLPRQSTLVDEDQILLRIHENSERVVLQQKSVIADLERELVELRATTDAKAYEDGRRLRTLRGRLDWVVERSDALHLEHEGVRERLAGVQRELAELRGSSAHRIVNRYHGLLERTAPRNSRRRALYATAAKFVVAAKSRPVARQDRRQESLPPPVELPTSPAPEVSIIIPVHGAWAHTRRCLESIAADRSRTPFEVVVVDDASPDDTALQLERCPTVRVVAPATNLGFVGACNLGARNARSGLLVFLNNDTTVRPGWLDALVGTLDEHPDAGLVGAKLVYPDGRLQEAGSIVWMDGTASNYGKGGDPDAPEYNFVRSVDYCSAAAVLVVRSLFERLGGFDERYSPAYYEDTDLAFGIRSLGAAVLYQPAAVVVHEEGVSHGTDPAAGVKRFQEINRAQFAEKWAEELKGQRQRNGDESVRLASRRSPSGLVVVADQALPTPDRDCGSLRMSRLLRMLGHLGFGVVFVPSSGARMQPYATALEQDGVEVIWDEEGLKTFLRAFRSEIKFVILSRPAVAWRYLPMAREVLPGVPVIYDTVDLNFLREQRRAEIEQDEGVRLKAAADRELELGLVRATDATLVVSDVERDVLLREVPHARVSVIPTIHDERPLGAPFSDRHGLLFVGGFAHPPNQDAVVWFVASVLPIIRHRIPSITLTIAGSNMPECVQALHQDGIDVVGWVPDLVPYYERARVFVAPLRYGAGVKGKIGESIGYGLPVVSTTIGVEGMDLVHERDVLVADEADSFAYQVLQLYTDNDLWSLVRGNGSGQVHRQFSPPAVEALLAKTLNGVFSKS